MKTVPIEQLLKQHYRHTTPSFDRDQEAFVASVMANIQPQKTQPRQNAPTDAFLARSMPSLKPLILRNLIFVACALVGLLILLSNIQAMPLNSWLTVTPFNTEYLAFMMNKSFYLVAGVMVYCSGVFYWLMDYNEPLNAYE